MKSLKVLISLALTLAIILSVGTVYAATDLGGGFFGHYLDKSTDISVSDGTLTATQNADTIYNYVDTNFHNNFGFEDSNEAINTSGQFKTFTSGWTTSDGIPSASSSIEITNISHSGKNALKITGIKNMEYRIFNTKSNATNSTLAGITEGLDADTTYLVSYWVKGNAASRVYAKSYSSNAWNNDWGTKLENPGNLWKLYTKEVKTNSLGEAWYNVFVCSNADTEIYIDDICLQTKAQAIANVETMIQKLDVNSKVATRAIDDINQWVSVLGAQNIDNYATFEEKLEQYAAIGKYEYIVTNNLYMNPGFEESDVINNSSSKAFYSMTEGWTSPWSNSKYVFSLSDVSHSGNKSIYIKLPVGSDNTMLVNRKNIVITSEISTDTDGRMDGLTSGEKYIMSYWVKGDAATRAWLREIDANGKVSTSLTTSSQNITAENDWKLFAAQFTPNTSGEIYCVLNYTCNSSSETEAYIDDVSMQTVSDAIRSVETMIDNLDVSTSYAARAIDDIEQWVNVLGSENISNYDLFLMKKSGYVYYSEASTLDNTGFEKSDSAEIVKNNTGTFKEITTGWVANYTTATMQTAEISNDAHSGNNALKISVMNNNTEAGKQVYYNLPVYSSNISDSGTPYYQFDKANTKYIVSAWVKGAKLRGGIRLYDEETATWQTATTWQTIMENDAGDKWTLYTFNVTTNSLGQAQWFINVPQVIDSTATVIIDDIQVLTLEDNIKLVDSLIDQLATFDKSSDEYARAKADIEQWLPVLDSADLNLKYDIVLNEKYNIITPNEGYTHLAQGDYIASVTLKGKGEVNRVYGDNITNITSILTELIDEYVTHRERVTVGAYGTHYMGVQLLDTTAINTVDIKNFSLKRVGDVNESGEIDIRDMVHMVKGLSGTDATVDELVADYDNSASFDAADITAIREKIMNTDKLADVLRGKTVSVIGDSISTFKGYNNNIYSNTTTVNNSVCYYDGKPNKYDEYGNYLNWQDMKVDDTYWKQIIDITETRLLVNNAWSGSSIAKQGGAKRGVQLHDNYGYYNGETPDIILVHYGTNDYLSFVSQGDEAYGVESFAASYDEMVAAMLETYEDVDIYLFTFPHYKTNEDHIAIQQEYNDAIRATAEKYRCPLVDLHNNSAFNLETFKELTVDGLHPNKAGMDAITDTLYNVMCEQYIK